jgi:serine phosphatase RsbU (regulator of sigma subunit)
MPVARDERPGSRDRAEEPRDSRSSPAGRNIVADDHHVGMLAAFSFASHSTAVHKLEAGDRIVMYTHGILEASNAGENFFGHDALCDLLKKTRGLSPAMAADSIVSSVRQWSAKQDDDLTVLVCDYMRT